MKPGRTIRVLVVDDSAIVRRVLSDILSAEDDIEVVGTAPDPFIARDKIVALQPDVLTLDIEMPRMDGLTFLGKLMEHRPMPVVVISSLAQSSCEAALEAVRRGAVDVLAKPGGPYSVGNLKADLPGRIRAAAMARPHKPGTPEAKKGALAGPIQCDLVAIGASTGGTQAIESILTKLPSDMPPIAIVQHIPPVFSAAFAERLNKVCGLAVKEAAEGDELERGMALVAPGDYHLTIESSGRALRARLNRETKVCYQRPSVDVLFRSVAATLGRKAVGVLLTGMGKDGAEGLMALREAGAHTIAQDEQTCVVFGMPREAIRMGAAERVIPLDRIPASLTAG